MATNGDTLSLVLLVVAICSTGLAACGALVLGALAFSRRRRVRRAWRESVTVQFRSPVASDLGELDSPDTGPSPLLDPTDRFSDVSLFESAAPAEVDPFEGDTVPFIDLDGIGRTEAVADL
jgi:hypothetical protein